MCQAYEGEHQFILAQEKWGREKKEREPAVTVREIEGATVKVAHDPPPPPRYIIRTYDPTMQEWCFDEMRDDKPDLTGLDSGFVAEIIDTRPDLRIGGQARGESKAPAPSHGEAVPVDDLLYLCAQAEAYRIDHHFSAKDGDESRNRVSKVRAWLARREGKA